ncbi:MAG: hypothetical protein V4604_01110 [Bacteroidota bacterium]
MTTDNATAVQSHEDVTKLADGKVLVQAKYSFQNPYSINGPFGTLNVTLTEDASGQGVIGNVTIQTLFGMGTETTLQYNGTAVFNPSTGYTNANAVGKGVMHAWPNPDRPVTAKMNFELAPGFKSGTLTVDGFLQDYALTATSIQIG